MATLTKEQVEQKLQQLKQLAEEVSALTKELAEAGVLELSEEDLENVAGGIILPRRSRIPDVAWSHPKIIDHLSPGEPYEIAYPTEKQD